MELYNGLPLYRAEITDEEDGMYAISLVDFPATESDFMAFDKKKKLLKYAVEDEEKRVVRGLVMGANQPIYRRTEAGYEYFITYSPETIRKMAEKYLKDGLQNNVDTQHNDELENGIYMQELFIKDTAKGINPVGFEDYDDGSLFCQFHITNDKVWDAIKSGEYKGFSLAGFFTVEPAESEEDKEFNEVMSLLERINKKINNYRNV